MCEKNVDLERDADNNIELQHQVEAMEQDIQAEAGFEHDFEGMAIIPDDSVSVSVGKILLKLSAHFNVSETAINFLTKNLLDTFMNCGPCSKNEIVESLQKLSTKLKRNKFFTKHFNYVSPEEIYFGSEEKQIRNQNGVILPRQIKTTFQNISVCQTLTSLFSNEDFFLKFFSEKKSSDGFLRSHRDGEHFENHTFLKRFPSFAVRFQVFYDDVDMVNPLGSKKRFTKLAIFVI